MAQRDDKALKRARKKDEELKKKRAKATQRPLVPQRVLTDYARAIVSNYPPQSAKRQQFEMNFHLFTLRVERLPFDEAWQEALGHIAKAMQETPGTISCQRGCSACCHQHVGLSPAEGARIQAFLQTQPLAIDQELVRKQSQVSNWAELSFADRRCVFLGTEGECRIYEFRPLTCRRYFVSSDPRFCFEEDKAKIQSSLNVECDAYLSAFLSRYGNVALPEFLMSLKKES